MRILRRWKASLLSFTLVAASLVFSLAMGELCLRLFFTSEFMVKDFDTGLRLTPGYRNTIVEPEFTYEIAINEDGFRSPPLNRIAEDRIVVMGDSHTFGVGVAQNETFSSLASQALHREVVNTASPGWDLIQFSRFARSRLASLSPSLVVYVLYAGNDLTNNGNWKVTDDGLVPVGVAPVPTSFWREWELPKLLTRALKRTEQSHKKMEEWRPYEPYLRLCEKHPSALARRYYQDSKKLFAELVEATRAHNLPMLVAVLPFKTAVEGGEGSAGPNYDLSQPTKTVIGWAEELKVPHVNLLADLKRDYARFHAPLYYFADGHLNARGHRVIAQSLVAAIESMAATVRLGYFSGSGVAGTSLLSGAGANVGSGSGSFSSRRASSSRSFLY